MQAPVAIAAVVSLLLACREPARSGHDHGGGEAGHGHAHGAGAVGITRWTEKTELFAEHAPPVAGKHLLLLSHLTILDGFRPLEQAQVTLTLEGPATVSGTVKKMYRSGIFRPMVKPTRPGTYRGKL